MAKLKMIWQVILGNDGRPVYCYSCGATNPPGSTICQGCGKMLFP